MIPQCFLLIIILHLTGFSCRTVSVVVKHRHEFAVRETREAAYIELPKDIEEELKFEPKDAGNQLKILRNDDVTSKQNSDMKGGHINSNYYNEDELYQDSKSVTNDVDDDNTNPNDVNDQKSEDDIDDDNVDDNDDDDDDDAVHGDENELGNGVDDGKDDDFNFKDQAESDTRSVAQRSLENQHGKGEFRGKYPSEGTKEEKELFLASRLVKRNKRAADERWRNALHGNKRSKTKENPPITDIWEDVTDEELDAIRKQQYTQLAKFAGWTFLSVVFFVLVGICFVRDPMSCIFSFATGCPCCFFILPCVRGFIKKHLDYKKMVRDALNKYTPGVIVHDDGTIQHYEPTQEEIGLLKELIDTISGNTIV